MACNITSNRDCSTQRFDMEAYLRRLRLSSLPSSPEEILRTLHRAHATIIPFENIDVLLGRGIKISPEAIQDKLLHRRRGGYCFEQNLLIAGALECLDFRVMRMAARVQFNNLKTHLIVAAEIKDRWWLVDVGFGSHLREPMRLAPGTSHQGKWNYRMQKWNDGWHLEALQQGQWRTLYTFRHSSLMGHEIVALNHFTATHPASPFVQRLIAHKMYSTFRYQLIDREFKIIQSDGSAERFELGRDQTLAILEDAFGIALDPTEIHRLKKYLL